MILRNPTPKNEIRISFDPKTKMHELLTETIVDAGLEDVFEFFSDASNLEAITPPLLKFRVLTPQTINIQAGTILNYRLRLHGFPIRWQSEISEWEPNRRFVDRQLHGPYRSWWHEHTFTPISDGRTFMRDRVLYSVPGGRLIHRLFVRNDLLKIFEYRRTAICGIFDEPSGTKCDETNCGC